MANREPDNQDQKQQNSEYNQFDLHVLIPHLPTDLSSLLSELLGLKIKKDPYVLQGTRPKTNSCLTLASSNLPVSAMSLSCPQE